MSININQLAPGFTLADQAGLQHTLSNYKGKWVLLYFYPKDDTPGCTTQACDIRDRWSEFTERGVHVFGISADDERSHEKFAEKHELPFTLLADTDHVVCEQYDVWNPKILFGKEFMGIVRTSFLIDPKGNIVKIYEKVNASTHVEDVLADLAELQAS